MVLVSFLISIIGIGFPFLFSKKVEHSWQNISSYIHISIDGMKGKEEDVLLTLQIPSIGLEEDVYNINSEFNQVQYHVQILMDSNLEKNLFFLAAHSGSGKASYFNQLIHMKVGDVVWIYYQEKLLCFQVEEIFYISKKGYFEIPLADSYNKLFLITCSLDYPDKQLSVKASLV